MEANILCILCDTVSLTYKLLKSRKSFIVSVYMYSALPNKRNGTLIIFCKFGNAVRSLLGAVW